MKQNERIFIGVTVVIMVAVCAFFGMKYLYHNDATANGPLLPVSEEEQAQQEKEVTPETAPKPEPVEKVYVTVYFIGQDPASKSEVYKAVKREYDKTIDGSKIRYAVKSLVAGPTSYEKSKGVYSEIPSGTNVISVNEQADKVIVNLNAAFEGGGGTDSTYKRLYQLIKTVKRNTDKPVYLYIEGQKADVIGGEGIMITQPLNENSLDG